MTMESVALFHTVEEMQWTSCGAIKATKLCDELIAIKTVAPTEPHIRAYIATAGEWLPIQTMESPASEEEDDTNPPTGKPQQGGGTPQHLQAELGDLADTSNCGHLWRTSVRRSHFVSSMHPQQSSTHSLGSTLREQ